MSQIPRAQMMSKASKPPPQMCPACADTGHVCENHPDTAWEGIANGIDACDCGVGGPRQSVLERLHVLSLRLWGRGEILRRLVKDASFSPCACGVGVAPSL